MCDFSYDWALVSWCQLFGCTYTSIIPDNEPAIHFFVRNKNQIMKQVTWRLLTIFILCILARGSILAGYAYYENGFIIIITVFTMKPFSYSAYPARIFGKV